MREGGRLRVPLWRWEAAENKLKVTVEAISEVARDQRRQEYGSRGGIEGGPKGGSTDIEG